MANPNSSTAATPPKPLDAQTADELKPNIEDTRSTRVRLLVVDDDPADRALVRAMIDSNRVTILEASSAKQGLELASKNHIECALVDYNLPDMKGTALLGLLRNAANDQDLPIILFTGQGDESVAVKAIQEGASDYLPKNKLNESSLSRVLVNGLKQASLSRSLRKERQRILEMNRELIRANHEISSFYQTVSHELKTPLMAIREFTSLTLDEIGGPITPQQREYLSTSLTCCDRLTSMINDLLDTARIESGKLSIDLRPCDINSLIENHLALLSAPAQEAHINIETELARAMPQVLCDELRIGQVINNLLTNALKFTPANGQIVVKSWVETESRVVISVQDTGRGIDPKYHALILNRFEQTCAEDADFHKGMGIGLYLCANILDDHGSCIEIESEIGHGSTFTFKLSL